MAPKTPVFPPPTTQARDESPEPGSPSKITQYNKTTGRPIRRSAGKVKKAAGYVDSSLLDIEEDGDSDPLTTDDSDNDMSGAARKSKNNKKRRRSPSPPSPRLEPIIYNQELDPITDDESSGHYRNNTSEKPPITLQFNVPLGFHGPLFVKLDRSLLKKNEEGVQHKMQPLAKKPKRASSDSSQVTPPGQGKGFLDLPPELRNSVYRHLFVRRNKLLKIPQGPGMDGLSLSSQILQTCRTVHSEGCSIMYGENTFEFRRHHDTRAPFWDATPCEIGYQDFLHFLKKIGAENIQYLRDIQILFEDGMPKLTKGLDTEERRFLSDDYLFNCLRILRKAKLRNVSMKFLGRRQIFRSDSKFLGYLEQIQADEVDHVTDRWYSNKMPTYVWEDLKDQMVRKKKLYEKT